MGPKKALKRKAAEDTDATGTRPPTKAVAKTTTIKKLTVDGGDEVLKQIKSTKEYSSIEELVVVTRNQGNNTVECFENDLTEIKELLPNLKSLHLNASEERDECPADLLRQIFKTWNGSETLHSLHLEMDWTQFNHLDQVLTGFSKSDCTKLRKSLGETKNIPVKDFQKSKYSLACLPGLKNLKIIFCDVERIDETDPAIYSNLKFEVKVAVLKRYLFSQIKKLEVDIKLMGDSEDDEDSDSEVDEKNGSLEEGGEEEEEEEDED